MTKVTEFIKANGQFSYSFEVTPDVSEEEIDALDQNPIFFSVTWHAKSHQCKDMDIDSLRIAKILVRKQKHVLLHISCDMMKETYLKELLGVLQENNICNLFLILGENYNPAISEFQDTSHLIKFIREHTGYYFCIGVAGFPDCPDEKFGHLKKKVDSGADFIITQAFFDIKTYKSFAQRCKILNINVPIIPGVFAFESYKQLSAFINLCKIKVSSDLLAYIYNKNELHAPCLEVVKRLIDELRIECLVTHFHFFTLNKLLRTYQFIQEKIMWEEKSSV